MLTQKVMKEFEQCLPGLVLTRDSADYDRARKVCNAMIDRSAALIARCRSTSDVAAAVLLARAHDIPTSIRGSGHNFAGKACSRMAS